MHLVYRDKMVICLTLVTALYLMGKANAECKSLFLNITVDDYLILYVDGAPITGLPNAFTLDNVDTVRLTCATKVIAVHGINNLIVGGIRASDRSGFILTNESWKCTNVAHRGWEKIGFDDSSWPNAVVTGVGYNYSKPGLNPKSKWIWSSNWLINQENNRNSDIHVYCRKTLALSEEDLLDTITDELPSVTVLWVLLSGSILVILLLFVLVGYLLHRLRKQRAGKNVSRHTGAVPKPNSPADYVALHQDRRKDDHPYQELADKRKQAQLTFSK